MTASPRPHPGGPDRVAGLDGCRGAAVLAVVVLHALGAAGAGRWPGVRGVAPYVLGWTGLAVFFTLSGFLLHRQLLLRPVTSAAGVGGFWLRRTARILPAWWVLLVVAWGWPGTGSPFAAGGWREWLLVQGYGGGAYRSAALSHSWSLEAEIGFYLVLPALVAVGSRLGRGAIGHAAVAAGLFVVSALAVSGVADDPGTGWVLRTALGVGTHFAVGMALAVAYVRWPRHHPPAVVRWATSHWWVPATAVAVVLGSLLALDDPTGVAAQLDTLLWWRVGLALVAGAALLPVLWARPGSPALRWLDHRSLHRLGVISYGIYLWHHPIVLWVAGIEGLLPTSPVTVRVQDALGVPHAVSILAAALVLSIAAAELSWRLVEAPAQAWARRRTRRVAPAPAAVGA